MLDAYDDISLIPTHLDLLRLEDIPVDGRVEAENSAWVVLRYPVKAQNPRWQPFSLLVNCPGVPPRSAPWEFKNLAGVLSFLRQLDEARLKQK